MPTFLVDDDGKPPPRKKCRPGKNVDIHNSCSPCALWVGSGSHPALQQYQMGRCRHTCNSVNECDVFSIYASRNTNLSFSVTPNSCVCDACYRDYLRFLNNECKGSFHSPLVQAAKYARPCM